MKRSQIILFVVFLVISGLMYFALSANKKEYNKEVKEEDTTAYVPVRAVNNKVQSLSLISYGQILPNAEVIVSMEVQGKLLKGDITMKPGTNFRVGQILYRVDNEEAFYALSAQKTSLVNLVLGTLPEIEMDFPKELKKWEAFMNDLNPRYKSPELPPMTSKEMMFMTSRGVLTQYYTIKSQEARLEKYFFAAPFNGTVIQTFAEPGSIANPGAQLAKIAKTGDFEVKVPIGMNDIDMFKSKSEASFTNSDGKKVATGKIIRVSDVVNQQTQSADVYYSIKALDGEKIYNGMYVNVSINQKEDRATMTIPSSAVKDNKVQVLEGGKIKTRDVLIISNIPDSVYVTGLQDGEKVLLERIDKVMDKFTYLGVER